MNTKPPLVIISNKPGLLYCPTHLATCTHQLPAHIVRPSVELATVGSVQYPGEGKFIIGDEIFPRLAVKFCRVVENRG